MNEAKRPFNVVIDHEREVISIQGISYSFGLFDTLSFGPTGGRFEIIERERGVIALRTLPQTPEAEGM